MDWPEVDRLGLSQLGKEDSRRGYRHIFHTCGPARGHIFDGYCEFYSTVARPYAVEQALPTARTYRGNKGRWVVPEQSQTSETEGWIIRPTAPHEV